MADEEAKQAPAEGTPAEPVMSGDDHSVRAETKNAGGELTFHLKVYSPYKTYYDDDVASVSAVNDTGAFDILAKHKNFMTLISPCDLMIRNGDKEEKIPVNRGIMHVKADRVIVFLDI